MSFKHDQTPTCNHTITLDNLSDGDSFTYSAIICSGLIENAETCTSQISVFATGEPQRGIETNTRDNSFKCILQLNAGSNEFTFKYCSFSISVKLHYKRRKSSFTVLPLYIVCEGHDGRFQAPPGEVNSPESACKRITAVCKLLQSVFGYKFAKVGMERRSYEMEVDCLTWHSKLNVENALSMTQVELWYHFAREIMSSGIGSDNRKYLAFLSCSVYNGEGYYEGMPYKEMLKLVKGYVAYGGDGLALLSTGCLYTWPETLDGVYGKLCKNTLVDKTKLMNYSNSRDTWGGCFIASLGAVLHELCHTFDLGHSEAGIMGPNFGQIDDVFLAVANEQRFCDYRCTDASQITPDYSGWSKSALFIIYYHKWFQNVDSSRQVSICYDSASNVVRSIVGIRVIEIRRKDDEMVLKAWVFGGKVLKFSFQIPVRAAGFDEDVILYAQDGCGNIFKRQIKL
ncbi:putative zinc metalloproteinase YIL108W [Photinus pyralis]|uniref:putative zinc metalloproteinase YIL108W n=1 Tax=Photinus pyralis TaxID=7054 RepID=UPI001266F911|nr:putative zinc metalloproteinase YIL108W [Photinus pyralis]XP_031351154.1 putative zinc metalloproteinase YIL108W [Photinus pyralis]